MKDNIENVQNKGHIGKIIAVMSGVLLVAVAIAVLLGMVGNTTTTTNKVDGVKMTTLSCVSNSLKYPFFTYDNSDRRELNVKMIFEENSLKSIALDYSLFYNDKDAIAASEAHNHAAMNISYSENGLNSDAFNTKYAILSDRVRMNLYADSNEINTTSAKYFLIDAEVGLPDTLEKYRKNYVKQGLSCELTE